ncbi:MAG: NfeD family protein [Desulfosarcinaceae bacterium]|nr:NfeD family protein [Desulfosarcinaceae bacterium]
MESPVAILYWHWLIFGMLLMMMELFIPSMTILWFGLGGLLVGIWLWVAPGTAFSLQLFVWALASCACVFLWFKLLKPRMVHKTTAGISREAVLGEVGRVIKAAEEDRLGRVRFTTPLLGEDEWSFRCEGPVAIGDRVAISDISGNTLIVTPVHSRGQKNKTA